MRVERAPIAKALGHVLLHNQVGPDGRKVLKKGECLTPEDLPKLQALGREQVYVAILATDDVAENEAARRLGEMIAGEGLATTGATTGRVNLLAASPGLFKVKVETLLAFNSLDGLTLATIPNNTLVQPKKMVGTIKVIPYAVPESSLQAARAILSQQGPLVAVKPFVVQRAALITTGSEAGRQKVIESFTPALRHRLAAYGAVLVEGPYVAEEEEAIRQALQWALDSQAEIILVAGETSVTDIDDITPRAIKAVGGEIVHYGAPVEPGNLLLLAYHGRTPIMGAPGCARSKNYNVVDMVLPRLAAGERLVRRDIIELGHGGLLD